MFLFYVGLGLFAAYGAAAYTTIEPLGLAAIAVLTTGALSALFGRRRKRSKFVRRESAFLKDFPPIPGELPHARKYHRRDPELEH